jgi:type I restriction enzyme S subunit
MSSNEWVEYKLGDICTDISYGYTASADWEIEGPKFLRITDIQDYFINWNTVPQCPISESDRKKYLLEIGDIVIARTGASTGSTFTLKDEVDAVFASYLIRYKIDNNIANPFYIGYLLKSLKWKEYVSSIIGGSAQPGANAKQFADFDFILPDKSKQGKIVDLLSAIDEKIENNLATNQTLEEIARTLFKEWFVNFNYPNTDGNLKNSEFGEIPENWEVGKFGDLADQIKSSVNPSQFPDKEFNHYSLPAFDTNELPNVDLGSSILSNKTGVRKYSVLFSKLNPRIPRIWSIGDIDESNSICSTEFIGFTPKQDFFYSYINYFLKQPELVTKLTGIAMGTSNSHQRIKPADLLELEVIIPDEEVVKQFEKIIRPLLETRFHKIQENESLKITRDSLLPKLMSGEIEINS